MRPPWLRPAGATQVGVGLAFGVVPPLLALGEAGFAISASGPLAAALVVAGFVALLISPLGVLTDWRVAVGACCFVGLAALTLVSLRWSPAVDAGWLVGVKSVAYAAAFLMAALLVRTRLAIWGLLAGLASGATLIAIWSLVSVARSTNPEPLFWDSRLATPVGYANGLALVLLLGALAALALAAAPARRWWHVGLRAGTWASLAVIAVTISATQSRGTMLAGCIGLAAILVLSPDRGRVASASASAAVAAGLLFHRAVDLRAAVTDNELGSVGSIAESMLAGAAGAAAIAAGLGAATAALEILLRSQASARWRESSARTLVRTPAFRAGAVVLVAVCLVGGVAAAASSGVADRVLATGGEEQIRGAERLTSTSSNGRVALWEEAIAAGRDAPLAGQGAGGYWVWWNTNRDSGDVDTRFAHSVFLSFWAENGLPGLLLLLGWLVAATAAIVALVRTSGGRRVGATLGGLLLAWVVAASVDWHWSLPAATLPVVFATGAAAGTVASPERACSRVAATTIRAGAAVAGAAAVALVGTPYLADRYVESAADIGIDDPTAARRQLDRAEALNPHDPRIYEIRARVSYALGQSKRARAELVEAVDATPLLYQPWIRLADFDQYVLDDPAAAAPSLREALRLHRDHGGRGELQERLAEIRVTRGAGRTEAG